MLLSRFWTGGGLSSQVTSLSPRKVYFLSALVLSFWRLVSFFVSVFRHYEPFYLKISDFIFEISLNFNHKCPGSRGVICAKMEIQWNWPSSQMLGQNFVWAIEATNNSKQHSKIYVCVAERQGNVIHAGASVAGNFLLEEQARLRSSGISAARIWYMCILGVFKCAGR